MSEGLRIGRVFGVPISIHPSWFIVLAFMTVSLAGGVLPGLFPASAATYWVVAVVASLLLFASVLVHELAHSLVARAQGIPVRGVTLFLLGGVSAIEDEPRSPGREALLAAVGPLASLAIGAAFLVLAAVVQGPPVAHMLAEYLGSVNVVLALFNMLPGFPLDGGRVLHAVLWAFSHDRARATRSAAGAGRMVGITLVAAAAFLVVSGGFIGGLWTALVGWMLVRWAGAARRQSLVEEGLAGVPVSRVMSRPVAWVPPQVTLDAAARDYLAPAHARCLPVAGAGEGEFDGAICVSDLRKVAPQEWSHDRVAAVMHSRDDAVVVDPRRPAADALRLMTAQGKELVAVVDEGRLVGLVDAGDVSTFIARRELSRKLREGHTGAGSLGHGGGSGGDGADLAA
jgi:Zn-dependent protease